MPKAVAQWLRLSEYRFRSAKVLLESGQYLDAVFHFQQAIEFLLKAVAVKEGITQPLRSHDLLELAAQIKGPVPPEQLRILDELHDISVPLRYPDDLDEALESYTHNEVERIARDAEELLRWLKQKLS